MRLPQRLTEVSMPATRTTCPDTPDLMPALTGIRFPLALWVVIHHLSGSGRMFDPLISAVPLMPAFVAAAWVALSIFFAISGFVLARRYHDLVWSSSAIRRYVVARFGRVYPVYFLSLLILVPIMIEGLRSGTLGSTFDRFGLVLNHVLLLQGWYRPAVNWNTPAWSLSSEVFFYACFPLVIVLLRQTSVTRWFVAAGLAFALPVALRLSIDPPIAKPLLYFGDFLIGIVAGRFYDHLRQRDVSLRSIGPWCYGPALVAGLLLLVFRDTLGSFLVFDSGVRLASGLLVFGLACGGGAVWRVLSWPLLVAGGRASYAIYILHVPMLWWYQRSEVHAALPPVAAGLVYVVMVVALSVIVSRGYEEPANDIIRAWFSKREARTAATAARVGSGFRRPVDVHDR